ncbi:TetR family transcriptional regulator [Streptomyces sp. CdTB01]|uniref:TetR/AcrR family transcriptional regulator n=1 Tax=Streptomyces sp. CdTB01 TaxID=1725411 RepID=UPI000A66E168|nr:TetR family transcriptional regulator [Streptomyces sp. CdTB01]
MSSPTPASNPRSSTAAPLSLTERRKAATRMEIARAAAGLFVRQGLRATRAEDIAQAAGVAPRTFYRYFATKEEAVAPLYAAGAERWTHALAEAPAHLSVPQALEHAVRHTLTPGAGVSAASWELVRTLIRLTDDSPALAKVWAEVCQESEGRLGEVLAGRMAAGAGEDTPEGAGGQENDGGDGRDNVGSRAAGSSRLRFAAAVAGAAVRVAVEVWAAGEAPASGARGPAALALRNLEAVRDFPWDEIAGEG